MLAYHLIIRIMQIINDPIYEGSDVWIRAVNFSMDESAKYGNTPVFLNIREEMNRFLLNLNQSHSAKSAGQQIHFLFVALNHLDNLDREIRISTENEEITRLEMIHDKIRSLKMLIQGYIGQLASG